MLSIQPGNNQDVELTGVTPVIVVISPDVGKTFLVHNLSLNNVSSAPVTAILYRDTNGTLKEIERVKDLPSTIPDGGAPWYPITKERPRVLLPGQSFKMVLAAPSVSAAPICSADFLIGTDS